MYPERVVSGMRPTGAMHLGHYHGALKNWIRMQSELPCLFFVADWHALTTHYADPSIIEKSTWDMVIDWLAAGIDPAQATIFIQSKVPEHAELHLLLFAFNLIPIPPLDGGRVLTSLLPPRLGYKFSQIEPYGFFIVMALLLTHVLDFWLAAVFHYGFELINLLTRPIQLLLS